MAEYLKYFDRQKQSGKKSPYWAYYSIIVAYLELGQTEKAYEYYKIVKTDKKRPSFTGWAMTGGYVGYKRSDQPHLLTLFEPLNKMAMELETK